MRALGASLLACAALLAGCGGTAAPTGTFEQAGDDERLVELLDQRRAAAEDVTLPRGTQHLRVRVDCIGTSGEIRVEVEELGSGSVPCGEVSSPDGFIGLSRLDPLPEDTPAQVRITAPSGSRWSAAVDAGPGRLPVDE